MVKYALLLAGMAAALSAAPAKVVLVAGKPSHPHGEHEFNAGSLLLEKCLRQNKGVQTVVVNNGWPADETVFDGARAIILYMDGGVRHPILADDRLAKMNQLMSKGVGLALLHYAVEVPKEKGGPEFLRWAGGFYDRPYSQNPINEVEVSQASPAHPVSRGWKSFHLRDELYYRIRFLPDDKRFTPILTTTLPKDGGNLETVAWTVQREDGGRGFGFTGAHFHTNWAMPDFRRMVVNAILWVAKVDVPRNGAKCEVSAEDLTVNLDPKPAR
jgi:type 1 glutamine amidotransferase